MHDAFAIAVPTFAVLLGIFLSRGDVANLRADMNRRFDEVDRRFGAIDRRLDGLDARLDRIGGDLKHFHNVTGKIEGRIDELSRR